LHLARDYVAEHFRDDISIDDLANLANVSRYHFIRAFHTTFGMPPHAYINQVRLQHARKLLLAGRNAGEAATESGFYDQSRLNRLFKRAYGVTPARYAHLARL
jgi:AraC-like DNA-binding protein